jgi:hypothetical protein
MQVRPDEEAALDKLREWLAEHAPRARLLPSASDPPDAWMELDDDRYAVEITGVYRTHRIPRPTSAKGVARTLARFAETLQHDATRASVLSGSYTLVLSAPSSMRLATDKARDCAFDYLRRTKDEAAAPPQDIYRERGCSAWTIRKDRGVGQTIRMLPGGRARGALSWAGDIEDALRTAVNARIQEKILKLSKVPKPWFLLLIGSFAYRDTEAWCAAVAASPGAADFHTIVLDVEDGPATILASSNESWASHRTGLCRSRR